MVLTRSRPGPCAVVGATMSRRRSWRNPTRRAPWSRRSRVGTRSHRSISRPGARPPAMVYVKPRAGPEPMAKRPAGTAAIQDRSSSSGEASSAVGSPGPGHQFVQTGGRPEIDQLDEDVGQIGLRLDTAELAGLDQRSDAGPVLRALIMPREQRILAIQNKRTDASLDDVGVKLDAAVVEEPREPVPVVQGVADM